MGEKEMQPLQEGETTAPAPGTDQEEIPPAVSGEVVPAAPKRLQRSRRDRVIAGVCGGIGQYFSIDPVLVRALWVFFTLIGFGTGALLYLVAMFVMPESKGEEPASVRRVSVQSNVFWGGLLILAGLYFLFRNIWERFLPSWVWDTVRSSAIAVVLVGAGLVLVLSVSRRGLGGSQRLTRPYKNRMIAGVCAGLANYLRVDPTWVRLIWIAFSLFATGSLFLSAALGGVIYVVAVMAIPEEARPAEIGEEAGQQGGDDEPRG